MLRQALPDFQDPLSPEELAGLACEPELESRLVFTKPKGWSLKSGPFRTRDFRTLPDRDWTLLVQTVDHWLPEVKALLDTVPFVPSWRVDDVMVSYATAGGGVGPHFDYYDVFLVQGQGSRLWKTGQRCDETALRRDDSGLKLLRKFHTEHEWLLESGDVLYVPPGVAHWGVSRDNSLCYSIGFRAPSVGELLLGFAAAAEERLPQHCRYRDPPWRGNPSPGEIDATALRNARRLLRTCLDDTVACAEWFGCQMTAPKYPDLITPVAEQPDLRSAGLILVGNPASRFAWHRLDERLLVFADGHCLETTWSPRLQNLAELLARANIRIPATTWCRRRDTRALLEELLAQGSLLPEEPEEAV